MDSGENQGAEPSRESRARRVYNLLVGLLKIFIGFFGTFSYRPPKWWQPNKFTNSKAYQKIITAREKIKFWVKSHKKLVGSLSGVAVIAFFSWGGWYYYRYHMPHPEWTTFTVESPNPIDYSNNGAPNPVLITFSQSAADMKLVGQKIKEGVKLRPEVKGQWKFLNDKTLAFFPEQEWTPGSEYSFSFDKKLFAESIELASNSGEFTTRSLSMVVDNSEFYQHPNIPKEKKGIFTLKFNYPVNPASFSERIKARLVDDKGEGRDVKFTIQYGEKLITANIHSEFLPIPERDSRLEINISQGVKAELGGVGTQIAVESSIEVPGMFNFFKIASVDAEIIRNEKYELENILVVNTTAGARSEEVAKSLNLWLLPLKEKEKGSDSIEPWDSPGEITPKIKQALRPVELQLVPSEFENSTIHTFKIKAGPGQSLYVKINKGLKSFGDYVLAGDFESVMRVPDFPKELLIMHQGSILSLRGDKKIPVLSRNVAHAQFLARRLRPNDLQHLLTQSDGEFQNPSFINSWLFSEDNISETFTEERAIDNSDPKKTVYDSFDFSKYLNSSAAGRARGVFFFSVTEWDPKIKTTMGEPSKRFIVLTDLGVITKLNVNGEMNVFVQSFSTGQPVSGARVEVLALNGTTLFTDTTDAKGSASFPELSQFQREKRAVAIVVKTSDDYTFLPLATDDRTLNFQRFDVGGVTTSGESDNLLAFVFTDRGIYRPGDKANFGLITKNFSWSKLPAGLPLEFVVLGPSGVEIMKEKFSLRGDGVKEFSFSTEENSATGSYHAQVFTMRDGNRSTMIGSTVFKVEEFLPDRMKILATLSKESLKGWVEADQLKAKILLTNLFGTPAQNRNINSQFRLIPAFPSTREYPNYVFVDPMKAGKSYTEDLETVQTDEKGEAVIDIDLRKFAPASYRLEFFADGFEAEGGRSVSTSASVFLSPLNFVIGYKADGDLQYMKPGIVRKINFIALDNELKKTVAKGLKTSLIEYKHVSVLTKQPNGSYKYQSIRKEVPVGKTTSVTIEERGLTLDLDTSQGGNFALVVSDKEGLEYAKVHYSVIAPSDLSRGLDRNAELQVALNKTDYAKGEEIELQIRAPYTGSGLITIEREKVFTSHWFKATSETSIQKIRIPASLEGNAYVSVVFLRAFDSQEIYTSPLSYGIAPFTISKESRRITISLSAPEQVRPGEILKINYSASKPTSLVLYGVDEGILQVAGYKLPDPLSFFFTKRALQVRTAQILDLLLPEYSIFKALSASGGDLGGDGLGMNLNPFKRRRDKPVAFWSGVIEVDEDEKVFEYEVPDYFNGSIRLMAVAASSETVGRNSISTTVRGDFVLSANVPTFVAPGDEFEVSIGVSNTSMGSNVAKGVKLSLETSDHLEVLTKAVKTLEIKEGGEAIETYRLKAKKKLGSASVRFIADWNGKKAKSSTELSIRPPMPFITNLKMSSTESKNTKIEVAQNMFDEYRELKFTASSIPLVLAKGLLNYLEEYQYGCTEQIISKGFPHLVLNDHPEFKLSSEKLTQSHSKILKTLRRRQTPNGGFGLWTEQAEEYDFTSLYALHYLTEAKERGLGEGNDLLQRGMAYLASKAFERSSSIHEVRLWAYSLYLQARNGIVPKLSLETLRGILEANYKKAWRDDSTGIYIAGTYAILQNIEEGEKIISSYKSSAPVSYNTNFFYDQSVREGSYIYVSGLHFPQIAKDFNPNDLMPLLSPLMKGGYTTINTSYAILGLNAYVQATKSRGENLSTDLRVFEKWKGGEKLLNLSAGLFSEGSFSPKALTLEIQNKDSRKIFYQTTLAGLERDLPKKTIQDGLEIQREFLDNSLQALTSVKKGEEIWVRLRARTIGGKGLVKNVALVDLLPGGFEVVLESIRNPESSSPRSTFASSTVDVREDRVLVFGDLDNDMTEYFYKIKATNAGTFVIPPPFTEAMYDRTLKGRGLSSVMTVAQ
jgi:uncharacterized protein YfaS (alpha-2-macroglobulin family)